MVVAVAFAQAAVLLSNGRKAASFASLMHGVTYPVDTRVAADLPINQIPVRSGTG